MKYFFTSIFDFFAKRRKLYWICLSLSFLICTIVASRISFKDDVQNMIAHDEKIETLNNVLAKTKSGEQIIFNLSFRDSTLLAPDSLVLLLQDLERNVLDKFIDNGIANLRLQIEENTEMRYLDFVREYLPIFLSDEDYMEITELTKESSIYEGLNAKRKLLQTPAGMMLGEQIAQDPIGIQNLALDKFQSWSNGTKYQVNDGYLFSEDEKYLTFFIQPQYSSSQTGENALFLKQLDRELAVWQQTYPAIEVMYFGAVAVAATNAVQMKQDTYLTLSLTIVLLLWLTYYVFRRKRMPFFLMLPVVFGALFGLAITVLVQGSIAVIAIGIGAVILGIALDFSIHFMSHARVQSDMRKNVAELAHPLTLGALTTIGAFFILRWANAPVLQDLGLYAATSLIGASLFTLIFLPHLPMGSSKNKLKTSYTLIDKLARWQPENSKKWLLLLLLATPILGFFAQKVKFNSDLMQLNYMSPELTKAQEQLTQRYDFALGNIFVVAQAQTEDSALAILDKHLPIVKQLHKEGKVKSYTTPVEIIPSKQVQQERIQKWNAYWTEGKKQYIWRVLQEAAINEGFEADAFVPFADWLKQSFTLLDDNTKEELYQMMPGALAQDKTTTYRIATLKIEPEHRSDVLQAFLDDEGMVVTDRQAVNERLLSFLQIDFDRLLFYSGALVFIALLIVYGRIELALIAFLPMVVTWIWTLGFMGILGLEFNVVNIMISTLIFGLGDDYSIFMMDGLMEKYKKGKNKITTSRSGIYLSVITTIVALGVLIFAKHPALQSIAATAVVGLVCVVFVSQILQPFMFNFLIQKRADRGQMPFTLWSLFKSVFSFIYFFIGCVIVTFTGFLLMGIKPFGRKRSKYLFHYILSRYTGSVMYVMANLKKRFIGLDKKQFETPAVYIANHSSFLDILLTTMLHPKLVLLTSDWVWNSPVFGKIVRMAEYYPVADGAEESIGRLKKLVAEGYSILVFPEGTRSTSDKIHRFKKGAFYIAEKLNLNIVPILLHGVHYTMPKGDWLLKDGTTTVKVLPAILVNDVDYGVGYRERAKQLRVWMTAALEKEKQKIETPTYFKEQMIVGSIYKGPVLEWYCRIKIKLEDNYEVFHQLLPREGKFYDLGCGYGFMTNMLQWSSEKRHFIGIDYDEDKIMTAQHHYKVKNQKIEAEEKGNVSPIQFYHGDISECTLELCNGIIISDVLHYLTPKKQNDLLEKAYHALLPGGLLIVRDGVVELQERHQGTKMTEFFSTRLLKFNKTQNELHFITKKWMQQWAEERELSMQVIDNFNKLSNLIFVMQK